jgi:phosphoglycolate phosphatase-like HAD superfamily hydrolase
LETRADGGFDKKPPGYYYVNMNLKLAFFDIDGTLIWRRSNDGLSLKSSSFNYALNVVFGLKDANYLTILGRRLYGLTDRSILKLTLLELGFNENDYYEHEKELFRIVDDYFERHRLDLKEPQYNPNPGSREFLDRLRSRKIRMGLVTGNIRKHADWKMEGVGFSGYFTTGGFGDDGEDRMEIMSAALARNSDIPYSSICHFGDSPHDILAALKSGIRCVALTNRGGGTHSREELESAGYGLIIDSWNESEKIEEYLG